jgi:antitoxin component of RelBE/YafQ-DinJ toxin-antitoxin module
MRKGLLTRRAATLVLVMPLLTACHRPGDLPVDTSLQDNSAIREEVRQQEIQREMEQAQRAADMQRAQQMATPNISPH